MDDVTTATKVRAKRAPLWNMNKRRPKFPQPVTVIDVGVGSGTVELYREYPNASFLLVEALTEFEDVCAEWIGRYKGEYVIAAAGPENGSQTLYVNKAQLMNSTLSTRDISPSANDREERVVRTIAIDDYVISKGLKGPFILKIDTEGHDLGVLQGADKILDQTLFVVSECWLHNRYSETPSAGPVIDFLARRGFSMTDVLEIKFNKDGGCRWANLVFANDRMFGEQLTVDAPIGFFGRIKALFS